MKKTIHTDNAPKAIGPYSQAVETNGMLFISGQLPVNPVSGKIESDNISEQTDRVLKNIGAILEAAGYSYKNVVKSTVLLKNMSDFAGMNEVYAKYYTSEMPARVAYEVAALPMGALVEIETVAAG